MTFDEAIEVLANSENNKLAKEDQLEYGLYRAYDVVGVLQKLRQEYAPPVEMTKEQKTELLAMKNNEERIIDIVGDTNVAYSIDNEFTIVTEFLDKFWEPLTEKQLIRAWLHPETIKIVDE